MQIIEVGQARPGDPVIAADFARRPSACKVSSRHAVTVAVSIVRLRARLASAHRGRSPEPVAGQAMLLAERLRGCGPHNDADLAELIAARAMTAAGRPAEARQRIAATRRSSPGTSLEVSLLRRLARAELAELEGRPTRMLAELRSGLAMVQARRGRLGSIDLQTPPARPMPRNPNRNNSLRKT